MIGERMASKAMINKTMIDRIEMKQKLMQWRSALVLVTMLLMLPLQMLAAELGEAGKRLAALPGVSDVEALESTTFPEKYVFFIKQQLDGKDASKGTFEQRVVLCHRGFDRPTVLVTEGYSARYALYKGYIEELAKLFDTNIIFVEYRYFEKSMPTPCNWDYLTVENSLDDLHHVNQTLHAMYKGKWIATGISKGGQTTMFYRCFFPDDVDISVPYVAPLNRSVEDGRHEEFLQNKVSTKENRQRVLDFQLMAFKRKEVLVPMLQKYCDQKQYTNFHGYRRSGVRLSDEDERAGLLLQSKPQLLLQRAGGQGTGLLRLLHEAFQALSEHQHGQGLPPPPDAAEGHGGRQLLLRPL